MDQLTDRLAQPSTITNVISTLILVGIGHYFLRSLSLLPDLIPLDTFFLWNLLVLCVPLRLLVDAAKRAELSETSARTRHDAKSEALRRMLGLRVSKLPGASAVLQRVRSLSQSQSVILRMKSVSDAPPGLGNWDNSCYQNSVLQSLAAFHALPGYLHASDEDSTTGALSKLMQDLSSNSANGKQLWTPAKLKSMSSWQQQDAQEYFSKIIDELEKESAKSLAAITPPTTGLADLLKESHVEKTTPPPPPPAHNPIEGLLAQQVICTRCGFSEGLSLIPFNCLTVPLGSASHYTLAACLDESTKVEAIEDVTCAKCTLLRAEAQIERILASAPPSSSPTTETPPSSILALPPDLRLQAAARLAAIKLALDTDDFADKTLAESCSIPKRAHVASTKTRQAVIARAPHCLVVHVNRSVFEEMTGLQRKNYAGVGFEGELDLRRWMYGSTEEGGGEEGEGREEGTVFKLRAVVEHYGRHDNGHYICYRQHGRVGAEDAEGAGEEIVKKREQWWRLSDEDVEPVSEATVLGVGGVFMLFYERVAAREMKSGLDTRDEMIAGQATQEEEVEKMESAAAVDAEQELEVDDYENTATATSPETTSPSPLPLPASTPDMDTPPTNPTASSSPTSPSPTTSPQPLPLDHPTRSSSPPPLPPSQSSPLPPQTSKSNTPPPLLMRTSRGRQASVGSESGGFGGFGGAGVRAMGVT